VKTTPSNKAFTTTAQIRPMKYSLSSIQPLVEPSLTKRLFNPLAVSGLLACCLVSAELLAENAPAAGAAADSGTGLPVLTIAFFVAGLIGLSVLVITALTRWSHKQDNIGNMMPFCIRYLVETRDVVEKCEAATALGHVKDPAALLILVDVINDQETEKSLRKTASEALRDMSRIYGRYEKVIDNLLLAAEDKDHQKSIDILISNFENKDKKYVQSAYVIGREFLRLKQYAEAREWLQKAKNRNSKAVVYVHQISQLIDTCNEKLFSEGDVLFKVGDYYDALEHYALAAHDLGYGEKQLFCSHLRLACVYCKLKHYEKAYQETLHALHDHHETDSSLKLNNMLNKQRGEIGGTPEAEERRERMHNEIDGCVTHIMARLIARQTAI